MALLVERGAMSRLKSPERSWARQETLGHSTILRFSEIGLLRLRRSLGTAEATLVD